MLLGLLTYSTDPGEAAYYTVRNMASEWQKERGDDPGSFAPSARANALYYHKQAIKYGDKELAEKWLGRYMAMGGKEEGIEQSIKASHPIGFMSKLDKGEFVLGLKGEELDAYKRAAEWYRQTYLKPERGEEESEADYQKRLKEFKEAKVDHISPIVFEAGTVAYETASGKGKPVRKGKDDPRFSDKRFKIYQESVEDYQKRKAEWDEDVAAAQKWLAAHSDSPVVQQAVAKVRGDKQKKRLGRKVSN
jgi:hypothetical protein